uniref:ABC transporter permease n=1 Tax=Strongyloides venezuelensis TaxID=75913 RepID=A0A0K0G5U7_STRVS
MNEKVVNIWRKYSFVRAVWKTHFGSFLYVVFMPVVILIGTELFHVQISGDYWKQYRGPLTLNSSKGLKFYYVFTIGLRA